MENYKFEENEPVIWDSGFGYDIGFFKGIFPNAMGYYSVYWMSGITKGRVGIAAMSQVIPYSIEALDERSKKYGYRHVF